MTLPGLQFVHARGDGGPRSRTQVVIIHATDNPRSTAEGEAQYATHRADETSAHFYVDDHNAVQALRVDHIAWGALWHGNQISVQFELCGLSNHLSDATMRQAAPLVAEVCRRYGIPVRKISASQVRNGVRGICGHADITAAFPEDHGTHTDPGPDFPWGRFIDYVREGDDVTKSEFMSWLKDPDFRKALCDAVWQTDGVVKAPSSFDSADNPYWWPASILRNADDHSHQANKKLDSLTDPKALAAQVVAGLKGAGVGQAVSDEQLERVLRTVLGSVDEQPST